MRHIFKPIYLPLTAAICLFREIPIYAFQNDEPLAGRIEERDGQRILYSTGSPYEIGFMQKFMENLHAICLMSNITF